jgi:hypothetical protein
VKASTRSHARVRAHRDGQPIRNKRDAAARHVGFAKPERRCEPAPRCYEAVRGRDNTSSAAHNRGLALRDPHTPARA